MRTLAFSAPDPDKPVVFTSAEERAAWHAEIDVMIDAVVAEVLGPRVAVELTEEEMEALIGGRG